MKPSILPGTEPGIFYSLNNCSLPPPRKDADSVEASYLLNSRFGPPASPAKVCYMG